MSQELISKEVSLRVDKVKWSEVKMWSTAYVKPSETVLFSEKMFKAKTFMPKVQEKKKSTNVRGILPLKPARR